MILRKLLRFTFKADNKALSSRENEPTNNNETNVNNKETTRKRWEHVPFLISLPRSIVVGDPLDPRTQMGALNSLPHYQKVKGFVDFAIQEGATIHCGQSVDELTLPAKNKEVIWRSMGVLPDT